MLPVGNRHGLRDIGAQELRREPGVFGRALPTARSCWPATPRDRRSSVETPGNARSRQSAPASITASSSRIARTERMPHGSRRAKPATGQPTRSRRSAAAIRRWCAAHSSRASSSSGALGRSPSACSGRCGSPLACSMRRRAADVSGQPPRRAARTPQAAAAANATANSARSAACARPGNPGSRSNSATAAKTAEDAECRPVTRARSVPTAAPRGPAAAAERAGLPAGGCSACITSAGRWFSRKFGRAAGRVEPFRDHVHRQHRLEARPRPDDGKTVVRDQHLGHQQPAVIGRTHHRTVGAGIGQRDAGRLRRAAADRARSAKVSPVSQTGPTTSAGAEHRSGRRAAAPARCRARPRRARAGSGRSSPRR